MKAKSLQRHNDDTYRRIDSGSHEVGIRHLANKPVFLFQYTRLMVLRY